MLLICGTTPFAGANHLSKSFQFSLPKVGNYQSLCLTCPTLCGCLYGGGGVLVNLVGKDKGHSESRGDYGVNEGRKRAKLKSPRADEQGNASTPPSLFLAALPQGPLPYYHLLEPKVGTTPTQDQQILQMSGH